MSDIREKLAEYSHDAWRGWMKYMSGHVTMGCQRGLHGDGQVNVWLSNGFRNRWTRQMNTRYEDLPESEKESSREQADKILELVTNKPSWMDLMPLFDKWYGSIDQDDACDKYHVAFGWFSSKGYSPKESKQAAYFSMKSVRESL